LKAFYLYAESQIHAGTGADVGIVDLPIQRERTTGFPVIQGIKGALRASGIVDDSIFGSKPSKGGDDATDAGKVAFSEAKILLFPVRSAEKMFVWVTCPLILGRFSRSTGKKLNVPSIQEGKALVADQSFGDGPLTLEELELPCQKSTEVNSIASIVANCAPDEYIKVKLKSDLVLVSDDMFAKIVKTMTEVQPRIRIDEKTGIVARGALWYEEYLPQDSVLYFICRETVYAKGTESKLEVLNGKVISIGGKETTGKGFVSVKEVV